MIKLNNEKNIEMINNGNPYFKVINTLSIYFLMIAFVLLFIFIGNNIHIILNIAISLCISSLIGYNSFLLMQYLCKNKISSYLESDITDANLLIIANTIDVSLLNDELTHKLQSIKKNKDMIDLIPLINQYIKSERINRDKETINKFFNR